VHGAAAETAAAPAHEDQTLPLDWVKGIGKTYSKRLVAAGVPDLPALLSLERQRLAEVLGIGGSRLKRLADRLAQLRAVTPASLAQAPLDLTLEVIRQDRQPVDLDTAAWESLRDAVAPLMDIFDKDIHTQVRITDLHRLVRIIDEPMENTDA
jgi:nucleotidyltransferase/DNA polymerase involved in DNA repair